MIPEWNRKCKSKLVWLQEEMNHLTLTKHFSCDCKCKLNVRECHSDQKQNIGKFRCGCKNP